MSTTDVLASDEDAEDPDRYLAVVDEEAKDDCRRCRLEGTRGDDDEQASAFRTAGAAEATQLRGAALNAPPRFRTAVVKKEARASDAAVNMMAKLRRRSAGMDVPYRQMAGDHNPWGVDALVVVSLASAKNERSRSV